MPAAPFTTPHKFLVVTFKQGGEDTYNTIIRRNPTNIAEMEVFRPGLHYSAAEINDVGGLFDLAGTHLDDDFALPNHMAPLMSIWNAGDMALIHRVGSQFTPVAYRTQAEIVAAWFPFSNPLAVPPTGAASGIISSFGLGGHDSQSVSAGTMVQRPFVDENDRNWSMNGSGWGGRMAEMFAGKVGVSSLPIMQLFGISIYGDYWKKSQTAQNVRLPRFPRRFSRNSTNSTIMTRMLTMIDTLNVAVPDDPREAVSRNANETAKAATDFYDPISRTAKNAIPVGESAAFAVDGFFPDFEGNEQLWQGSLLTVARSIEWRLKFTNDAVKTDQPLRTAFMVGWPDWDTHGSQGIKSGRIFDMQTDWSRAVKGFNLAMEGLGVWDDCLLLDTSEFARTLPQNGGNGTDHAWARTCMVFGGKVKGKGVEGSTGHFGDYPTTFGIFGAGSHDVNGGQVGLGSVKPLFSWEEFYEPGLVEFGCDTDDLNEILPRRGVFVPPDAPGMPAYIRSGVEPYPLDLVTEVPTYAFSVRKLREEAPATCLRVRSTGSGNPELDLGYTVGRWFDDTALAAHIGANDGRIVRWHNQGSVGGFADQATQITQPFIALAGVPYTIGTENRIAPRVSGSNLLQMAAQAAWDIAASGTDVTVCIVLMRPTLVSNGSIFGFGSNGDGLRLTDPSTGPGSVFFDVGNTGGGGRYSVTWATDGGGTIPITLQRTVYRDGATMGIRRNAGASNNSVNTRSSNITSGTVTLKIFSDDANGPANTAIIGEIVIWNTGNVTGLAAFEADQMAAFGI